MFTIISLFGDTFWEKDFIVNELLPEGFKFIPANVTDTFEESDKYIVVFSSSIAFAHDIIEFCKKIKPRIIFHLSDEFGRFPEFHELAKYTTLYVRNYHHKSYPSVGEVYMPLGYISGMIPHRSLDISSYIPSSQRYLAWSFIGSIRPNREKMIKTFTKIDFKKPFCLTNKIDPNQMFDRYLNSVFVPSDRGFNSLDCFRIYEACIAGAIPVVVGDSTEMESTFKHEENPPWIFAKDWSSASMICLGLFRNKEALDDRQQQIISWWRKRVENLKSKISGALAL